MYPSTCVGRQPGRIARPELIRASIYESSSPAGHWWRESHCRYQRYSKDSDCGRLGRQAAGHTWSAPRVVKAAEKDCPTVSVLLEGQSSSYASETVSELNHLNYLQKREGEAGKRRTSNRIGQQIILIE